MDKLEPKQLVWVGSSHRDLRAFPPTVRRTFGVALFAVQLGETPPDAKPLKGVGGAGVLELIEDHRGSTYRAGLYGAFRDQDLCAACVSKEGEAGHCNAETRARSHPRAPEMGRAFAHW